MFTDASWSRLHKRAVWAAWAKLNGETMRASGLVARPMPQSGTAELAAISYGLYNIAHTLEHAKDDKILIQTDSLEAISAYTKGYHPRPEDREISAWIKDFAKGHGWRLELRHVKGHKGASTPRNAVNTWCDKECHRQMGKLLSELSGQGSLALVVDNTHNLNHKDYHGRDPAKVGFDVDLQTAKGWPTNG